MMVSFFLLVLLPVAIPAQKNPEDCEDVYRTVSPHSGVYDIYPRELGKPVWVYCDMDKQGGWTVIQRRVDGSVNFYRPWDHYKSGFGNLTGEHWLGLENIYAISWQKKYRLRVEMEDFEEGSVYAEYIPFSVDPEPQGYRLKVGKYIDGGAGDSLVEHNGMRFTTFDKDQDTWKANCAVEFYGAFWFHRCFGAHPNGLYTWGERPDSPFGIGVLWPTWRGYHYSLKSIIMKIRPLSPELLQEYRDILSPVTSTSSL